MRTRFRRRRKASWCHAGEGTISLNGSSTLIDGFLIDWFWLLPPARAQFMMLSRNRDRLTYGGSQMWLDFHWRNTGTAGQLSSVSMGVIKSSWLDPGTGNPDLSMAITQWQEPATPNSITTWDSVDDDDGTESYLWSHFIQGQSPPNAIVSTLADSNTGDTAHTVNQTTGISVGSADVPVNVCRKFLVTQEWQPDVNIRVKRRLQKGEGILLFMAAPASAITATINPLLTYHFRSLAL